MFDPDGPNRLPGENLRHLVDEVRREFFSRGAQQYRDSTRVVAIEVFDGLSVDAQVAIAADLVRADFGMVLDRDVEDIFKASDTPQAIVVDLVCEIVCQELFNDPIVVMENEHREALSE
jgi:hypothetical protein